MVMVPGMADLIHCLENAFDVTRQERFQDVTAKFMSVFEAQTKIRVDLKIHWCS